MFILSRANSPKHAADGSLTERKYSRSRVDRSADCSYVGYHVRWDRIWGPGVWCGANGGEEDATVGLVSVVIWFAARLQCTEHATSSGVASLHNEELNDLYCSPKVLRVINREEWSGWAIYRVWRRGEWCTGFWWVNVWERVHWRDTGVDGKIIL